MCIDLYAGKYRTAGGLTQVKHVVIVGRAFTSPARERAAALGFQLQTIETLEQAELSFFAGPPPDLPKNYQAEKREVQLNWICTDAEGRMISSFSPTDGTLVCTKSGRSLLSPQMTLISLIRQFLGAYEKAKIEQRRMNPGLLIQGVLDLICENTGYQKDKEIIPLKGIRVETPKEGIIGGLSVHPITVTSEGEKTREVIMETPSRTNSMPRRMKIFYEKPEHGKSPEKLRITLPGKTVRCTFSHVFKAHLAAVIRRPAP